MVALDTAHAARQQDRAALRWNGWLLGTGALVVLAALAPLAWARGPGHVSAAVMTALLGASVAAAASLLSSARTAFWLTTVVVVLLSLNRLPVPAGPGYEEPQALWRTDQVISASVPAPSGVLELVVQPVFLGDQPRFGLAGTVGGQPVVWTCPFQRGIQRLSLPVRPAPLDVQLRLTGTPSREQDYLIMYRPTTHDGIFFSTTDLLTSSLPVTVCSAG